MDAETTPRGAGTGPVVGMVPGVAGPEAAVEAREDPETDSRSAQHAKIWARSVARPGANAWKESTSASTGSTSVWKGWKNAWIGWKGGRSSHELTRP